MFARKRSLRASAESVPAEPAGWANWGILRLRQRDFDAASERLQKAKKLAPQNGHIYYLLGLVETGKGHSAEAIADFQKAIELDPKNLIATYRLAEETERQGDANSDAEFQKLHATDCRRATEQRSCAARTGSDRGKARRHCHAQTCRGSIKGISQSWPPEVQQQFDALQSAAFGPEPKTAALRTTYLRNVLMRLPDFRKDLAAIKPLPGDEAQPFTHFLRMETPKFTPAPPDTAMRFDPQLLANPDKTQWTWIGAVSLGDAGAPTVVEANGNEVRLASWRELSVPRRRRS